MAHLSTCYQERYRDDKTKKVEHFNKYFLIVTEGLVYNRPFISGIYLHMSDNNQLTSCDADLAIRDI